MSIPPDPKPSESEIDYDAYVAERWPDLPWVQAHSLSTYIFLGWTVGEIGRADEVNIHKPDTHENGYVRVDGIFRPA